MTPLDRKSILHLRWSTAASAFSSASTERPLQMWTDIETVIKMGNNESGLPGGPQPPPGSLPAAGAPSEAAAAAPPSSPVTTEAPNSPPVIKEESQNSPEPAPPPPPPPSAFQSSSPTAPRTADQSEYRTAEVAAPASYHYGSASPSKEYGGLHDPYSSGQHLHGGQYPGYYDSKSDSEALNPTSTSVPTSSTPTASTSSSSSMSLSYQYSNYHQ